MWGLEQQLATVGHLEVSPTELMKKLPPCPNCKRKGLHFANHPHAYGWKDYGWVECRFCLKRFKVKKN